jgi:GDP-mannose 6-dehydrogenase
MARKLLDAGFALDIYDPQLKPESLVGQNLGYAYAILPSIDGLLVDRSTAQSRRYSAVIATNRLIKDIDVTASRVIDVSAIA